MECNLKNQEFQDYFDRLLDKFIHIYFLSESEFNYCFQKLPSQVKILMFELYQSPPKYYNFCEDIYEKSMEVFHYYYKITNKGEEFTLRNNEHLDMFNSFLDKMLKLLTLSEEDFIKLFPMCPLIYWDKIDDLRETSFKGYRDSEKFTECLTKSKELSFAFEKLGGFNTEEDGMES